MTKVGYRAAMSNSGSGFTRDTQLRVAVPLPLVVAVIAELSRGTDDQLSLASALAAECPGVILANVTSKHDERNSDGR